ncbi:VOC family protein [Listeria ilorinensis]|uniref:VOC family protein n=1 Tax=Listeria ilorinensis TaxID=2867439 RepID=UPI001EF6F974|nr:VOC family protein [Listeria ilorinensis]
MAITVPYLLFDGQAEEALFFYKEVFSAEKLQMQRFQELDDSLVGLDAGNRLIHGRLEKKGEEILYISDTPIDHSEPLLSGNQCSIAFKFQEEIELHHAYSLLKKEGHVRMELQETFWGAIYANLVDKYGISWQLNWYKE